MPATTNVSFVLCCLDGVDVVDVSQFADEHSVAIFLDKLYCSGDESRLTECRFSVIHMCSHQQDVGIICHCKHLML